MYEITNYTKAKAKELGVTVKNSTNSKKKIDVYKNNQKVASIGSVSYGDYGTFLKEKGKGKTFADEKRRLYKIRHSKDRKVTGSNGWYADKLLW